MNRKRISKPYLHKCIKQDITIDNKQVGKFERADPCIQFLTAEIRTSIIKDLKHIT